MVVNEINNKAYNFTMRILDTQQTDFTKHWYEVQQHRPQPAGLNEAVAAIVAQVRGNGDEALLQLIAEYDGITADKVDSLCYGRSDFAAAVTRIPSDLMAALEEAAANISAYHQQQRWTTSIATGSLQQSVVPLERVGVYVPGGRATYPSSLLMAAIPAQLAGVKEIVVMSPAKEGDAADIILACAHLNPAIQRLYRMGGVQAIAALAYGTQSIKAVDKIVGPGNSYVTEAKRQVYGQVGIDMLAGPSEVAIVADHSAEPTWVAADLCAQAEHDPYAGVFLFSPDQQVLKRIMAAVKDCLGDQPRQQIIEQALANRGLAIKTRDMAEALALVNQLAAEHTQLMIEDSDALCQQLTRPPAIFCGNYSSVVFGDYCAGTNHILPTSPAGAFSSPLGVEDFVKRVSIVRLTKQQAAGLAVSTQKLAEAEGLFAHARAAKLRAE